MSEPEPHYSFTIPSLADDLPLQCRVHHPSDLGSRVRLTEHKTSLIRGVVFAHPYAPLGGCMSDPVVLAVTETLLSQGYVVGTFNFRYRTTQVSFTIYKAEMISSGAIGSEGRTTWSSRAEQEDYISFAGFMMHYLDGLKFPTNTNQLETIRSHVGVDGHAGSNANALTGPMAIILGGYSYGSLILARLPPVEGIIKRFTDAEIGTAAAEILLRATTLAQQTKDTLLEVQSPASPRGRQLKPEDAATSPSKRIGASPITVGGEETDPSTRRRSRDSRRSIDIVRKSIEAPRRIRAHVKGASVSMKTVVQVEKTASASATPTSLGKPIITTRYLVISPVLLPFTQLLCPPGAPSMFSAFRKSTEADRHAGDCFLSTPTLALFGSSDVFTASRRLKAWATKFSSTSKSSFSWEEIAGAGHFWHEPGVMQDLQKKIEIWVKTVDE